MCYIYMYIYVTIYIESDSYLIICSHNIYACIYMCIYIDQDAHLHYLQGSSSSERPSFGPGTRSAEHLDIVATGVRTT